MSSLIDIVLLCILFVLHKEGSSVIKKLKIMCLAPFLVAIAATEHALRKITTVHFSKFLQDMFIMDTEKKL